MSRFTKKVAARIVLRAVRSDLKNPSELPLRGMEANVLKALQYAEYVHHLALNLVRGDELLHKRLKASRRKRAALSNCLSSRSPVKASRESHGQPFDAHTIAK